MSAFWKAFSESNEAARKKLAALPWREKLRRLDALMERQRQRQLRNRKP